MPGFVASWLRVGGRCQAVVNVICNAVPGKFFGHIESVKILVILNPTAYMLTSSAFAYIDVRYILQIALK